MIVANRETSLEAVVVLCVARLIHNNSVNIEHLRSWLIMEFALACRYLVTPA